MTVEPDGLTLASKVAKLQAGLSQAAGDVFCFIDDDIALEPDALWCLIPYLSQQGVGAVFGLACAVSWNTLWSSLMSAFVNSHALLSYIPLTYLTDPFTITGHLFAISRSDFEAAGGLTGVSRRIDDDHELARRLRSIGLKSVQTPVIYRVSNEFTSFRAYADQMKRWFIFPRQAMNPYLSLYQKLLAYSLSLGLGLPPLVALLTLFFPSTVTILSFLVILAAYIASYMFCSMVYLKHTLPFARLPVLLLVAIIMPIQVLWALLGPDTAVVWRGQRLRVDQGGVFQVLE